MRFEILRDKAMLRKNYVVRRSSLGVENQHPMRTMLASPKVHDVMCTAYLMTRASQYIALCA
jgi:hypothetical protein